MSETKDYAAKRRFDETPEPQGAVEGNVDPTAALAGSSFVVQQHHATRLHFDLRLEMYNGEQPVLVSWAVPRNLPPRKGEAHLAVHVEDHPVEYATFSGTIPEGNYGAGEVRIFDSGTYELLEQEPNKLTFRLHGDRLRGIWHMVVPKPDENPKDWLVFLKKQERQEPEAPPELTPMLATSAREAFDDDGFSFEPKWDGIRAITVCQEETRLISRNRRDITTTYPELGRIHERVVALDAILDGEVVTFDEGRPSFERLQSRINLMNQHEIKRIMKELPVTFIAFDLLYLDGKSLIDSPLEERRSLLDEIVVPNSHVQVSPWVVGEGLALAEAAKQRSLEGIVAKRLGSRYLPGRRTNDWLKIKVTFEAEVVIGGWSMGEGNRSSSFGALLAGVYDGDDFIFVGAVGTGFSHKTIDELMPLLEQAESDECPFAEDPRQMPASRFGRPLRYLRWTYPVLVARVEFRELTSQDRLRAPSFKGLRHDKEPPECTYEELVAAARTA